MKIFLFSPYFPPHKGGLEQYVLNMALGLKKYGKKVTVITSGFRNEKCKERIRGIDVFRIKGYNLLHGTFPIEIPSKESQAIYREICRQKPDVIITNTRFFPLSLRGTNLARKCKIKHVHIEHGTNFVKLENKILTKIAFFYDKVFGTYVAKNCDLAVGISKPSSSFISSLGSRKVTTIYNSVDTYYFKRTNSNNNGKIICYIGRLIYGKGVQDLIEVFKKTKADDLRLFIAGDGNYKNKLMQISQEDKRIKFLGEINKDKIKNLLDKADIFVNPSYSEGLPTSVLEAGSMSLPIIATNVGGTAEIIDNKINGYLYQAGDKSKLKNLLRRLIDNKKIRKKFGDTIRKKIVNKFDYEKNISRFNEALKEI